MYKKRFEFKINVLNHENVKQIRASNVIEILKTNPKQSMKLFLLKIMYLIFSLH